MFFLHDNYKMFWNVFISILYWFRNVILEKFCLCIISYHNNFAQDFTFLCQECIVEKNEFKQQIQFKNVKIQLYFDLLMVFF